MADSTSGKGLEALSDAATAMSSPEKNDKKASPGCKCRKSHCLKHYCECFHNNLKCGDHCKCVRKKCENGNGKPKKGGDPVRSKGRGKSKSSSKEGAAAAPADTKMPPPPQQQPVMASNNPGGVAGAVGTGMPAPTIAAATVQYPGFNAPQQSPQGMVTMPPTGGAMTFPQYPSQTAQNTFAPQGNTMAGFPPPNNNMQFYLQQLQMAQGGGASGLPTSLPQQQPQQTLNFGGQFAPQQAPNLGNMPLLQQQQPMMQFPPPTQQGELEATAQASAASAAAAAADTKTSGVGGTSTDQGQPPTASEAVVASNANVAAAAAAGAGAGGQANSELAGEAPEAALLLLRTNTSNPLILAEKVLGPRPTSKEKSKLNAWNYKYKKLMKTGYEEVRKELQNNRRHQNRIRDKIAKEERRLAEAGKTMDAKDRKKYDDMLHDLDEKKVLLEEKRKKINETEKVWQRESREFKKMQFWSKPGAPAAPGNVPVAWDPKLLSGLPPPAAQGVPPPLVGDSKPAAASMAVEDAKNAADYAMTAALAVAGASSSKPKEDGGRGGGKESKKRKSSRSSSSRSKRKTRSVEGDVGDTAAV